MKKLNKKDSNPPKEKMDFNKLLSAMMQVPKMKKVKKDKIQ